MPKVSFIIPVYKMEQYLPRVFDALQAQTFGDFEAIFVDDGSPDHSGAMCDEFAAKDSRIKVIHQPNGGVAKARNTALDNATGDYLFFLDPDDWIEPNALEVLVDTATRNDADIVMFGMHFDTYDADGKLISSVIKNSGFEGVFRDEPCKRLFDKIATSHLIIIKMMRRGLIEEHHCRFRPLNLGEDGVFFADVYRHNPNCLVVIGDALYHYTNARSGSLSNSFHPERLEQSFVLSSAIRDVVSEWGLTDSPMHRHTLQYCTVRDLQMSIKTISLSPEPYAARVKWLKAKMADEWVRTAVRQIPLSEILSRNDKIKLALLKAHCYAPVIWISEMNQKH